MVTPVGNDVTTWDAYRGSRRRGADHAVRREWFSAHRCEVKGFSTERLTTDRKLQVRQPSHRFALAATEQAFRRCRHGADPETSERKGCTVSAGMMGVACAVSPASSNIPRRTASCIPASCSRMSPRPTQWCSAAANRRPAWRS
jgi:hypothetical protein